jgi:hypothetical protein
MEVKFHSFLASALDGDEWPPKCSGSFTPTMIGKETGCYGKGLSLSPSSPKAAVVPPAELSRLLQERKKQMNSGTPPPPPSPIKLASWQKVLAVFSIITQLFKKSNAFYGNRMLIPAFTQPTDPPLSQAPSFLFPSGFPTNIMHTFLISRPCYTSRQSNPCYYWNVLNSCAN